MTYKKSLRILSARDRKKFYIVAVIQILIGLLDLAGVVLIGVLGALAVNGVSSRQPGNRVFQFLSLLHIEDNKIQFQAFILGSIAALLLIFKTAISIFLTRRITFFLSRKSSAISDILLHKLVNQSLFEIRTRSLQENLYAVTAGVSIVAVDILTAGVMLVSDFALLVIMLVGLVVIDPIVAISTLVIFFSIAMTLNVLMSLRIKKIGAAQARLNIDSNQQILELIETFRELFVHNRQEFYASRISKTRENLADIKAEISFMPNIGKYTIELAVVIGAIVISGIQFKIQDAVHAVAVLSVFLAASTRIAPSILRIQQSLISIKANIGTAKPTLDLIESLENVEKIVKSSKELDLDHRGFIANVNLQKVTFRYPDSHKNALEFIDLEINQGQSIAIVGPSGAGKTTLVDALLGINSINDGSILISNKQPREAILEWPGAISYVPQDVLIVKGSFRNNVALGFNTGINDDDRIWKVLRIANLDTFVSGLPNGLETEVGDRGVHISGGQRQRLGIARALFTNPKLLVLDEATSSLDGKTEIEITKSIQEMHGDVTVITIAHRLSTVKNADKVVYLEDGRIKAFGTFEEVRSLIPDFDVQAKLMGM